MTEILVLLAIIVVLFVFFSKSRKSTEDDSQVTDSSDLRTQKDDGGKDAWEGTFWEAEDPIPVRAIFQLKYRDGNGSETHRKVSVRNFDRNHLGGMFIGHCHLRGATRTFRVDRVIECIDIDSGEIVEDLSDYLTKRYESSPEFTAKKLLDSDYDTLRVLLYVGKADGQFRKAEKQIYLDVCKQISSDSTLTHESIEELIGDVDDMSITAFKQAIGRLSKKSKETQQIVFDAAEKMLATQKTVHAVEQEATDYMKSRFFK